MEQYRTSKLFKILIEERLRATNYEFDVLVQVLWARSEVSSLKLFFGTDFTMIRADMTAGVFFHIEGV